MKVIHWNTSKERQQMSGVKNYEDNLFENLKNIDGNLEIERIQRSESKIFGSMPFSWLFRYKCKEADIVHATFHVIAPAIYFRRPKKFVITVLDLAPLIDPSSLRDFSLKLQWKFTPKVLKNADRIIAISQFTKDEIIRLLGIEENKIDVVYLGVDHSIYKPIDKIKCKEKVGLCTEDKHILIASAGYERKRLDLAKEIFKGITNSRDDVKMIKTGYDEGLKGTSINMGYIAEEDMPYLFNAADVYMHTAEYEGFGLPILEAMACGVPVVVSDRASIPEVVGDYGNMVDLDSDDCVEQFVEKILSSIEKGKDEKAVEESKEFSWEKTAKETFKVYEEVMK